MYFFTLSAEMHVDFAVFKFFDRVYRVYWFFERV